MSVANDGGDNMEFGYRQAGVGLDRADEAVHRIRRAIATRPSQAQGLSAIGQFAGEYALQPGTTLLAGADGVGTKILVAKAMGEARSLGVDLVAMNVNDVLASGGRPLFFLDYIASQRLDPDLVESLVEGMIDGCDQAQCVLLGGETAEMPGLYAPGDYDLAGFAVGLKVFDGTPCQVGDLVLGILADGFHANGFSLVRKIVQDSQLDYHARYAPIGNMVLGSALLKPTPIYVAPVLETLRRLPAAVRGMAHITGGGLIDNLPRALPQHLGVELDRQQWAMPELMQWFQQLGGLSFEEMVHSFNGGIGFAMIVDPRLAEHVVSLLAGFKLQVEAIGTVIENPGVHWK